MKNFFLTLALMLLIGIDVSQAQTVTESWALGFGLKYPRYASVNITSMNFNYGAYLSIQKNFSEHVGMRLKGGFANIKGEWTDALMNNIKQTTNVISADLDMVYYVVPCAPVSPYVFAGAGGNYKLIKNGQSINSDNKLGTQLNVGLGAEFKISPSWSFVAEYTYSITNNSELDGTTVPTEINGRDSYIALSAGFNYFFDKGAPSPQCEPCQGIQGVPPAMKDMTDYKRIEDLIKSHIPKEVTKEVVVDRYIAAISNDRLVLVGVNFAFDKSDLLPESYPVLDKAVVLLNDKPDVRVEIEGYTDYIGTDAYNQELSVQRAEVVKAYMVSKGIADARLSTVGYGRGNPVGNNETEEGRTMNRRIVFRILK